MKATKSLEGKTILAISYGALIVARISQVYPSGRSRILAVNDNNVTLLNARDIRVVDDSCRTLEDFKEKYPEEFV